MNRNTLTKEQKVRQWKQKKKSSLLQSPLKVFLLGLAFSLLNFTLRNTPLRLWSLKQEYQKIFNKKINAQKESKKLDLKIKKILNPEFIELEAKNRFDLAKKEELIFVFSKSTLP